MDKKNEEPSSQEFNVCPSGLNHSPGKVLDVSPINTDILQQCRTNTNNYSTQDLCISGVNGLNLDTQENQCRLDLHNLKSVDSNCYSKEEFVETTQDKQVEDCNIGSTVCADKDLESDTHPEHGFNLKEETNQFKHPGAMEVGVAEDESKSDENNCSEVTLDSNSEENDLNEASKDNSAKDLEQIEFIEGITGHSITVHEEAGDKKSIPEVSETPVNLESDTMNSGSDNKNDNMDAADENKQQERYPSETELFGVKSKKLDKVSSQPIMKLDAVISAKNSGMRRHHSSGSDIDNMDDDGLVVGDSQELCECDECMLLDEPIEKPKIPALLKKQSSWKKIRNIVHWSPFIQQFKRRRYPWIQLAGHQGNFQAGGPGAILKKLDKKEHRSFNKLMNDVLRPYVPEYRGESEKDGDCYIQLQDLLCDFEAPCVMDIKMGCRTYLEEELSKAREKPTLRGDMYKKMIEVDPKEPTEEEHKQKAITKPRYMQWRDDMSSTTEMGFRIEGIRKSDGAQVKNFKTTKDKASVKSCLKQFVEENPEIINKYLRRLKAIRATQEDSPFFKSNEIIGSSLLFVHDRCGQACIWMIDFGKTVPLPESVSVNHRNKWVEGNHEDGYLTGIDSLINIFEELEAEYKELSGNSVPRVEKESVNTARIDSKNDDSENSNKIASNQGSSDNSYKTDSYQGSSDNSNKIVSNHGNRDHSDKSVAGYHSNMEVDHKNNESIV